MAEYETFNGILGCSRIIRSSAGKHRCRKQWVYHETNGIYLCIDHVADWRAEMEASKRLRERWA